MDPTAMFPKSYHPVLIDKLRDLQHNATYYTRTQRPPKYYFIDLGIARRYAPEELPPLEKILLGHDGTVPEHHGDSLSANPFKTDIYCLGNLIRTDYLRVRTSFEFILTNSVANESCRK